MGLRSRGLERSSKALRSESGAKGQESGWWLGDGDELGMRGATHKCFSTEL